MKVLYSHFVLDTILEMYVPRKDFPQRLDIYVGVQFPTTNAIKHNQSAGLVNRCNGVMSLCFGESVSNNNRSVCGVSGFNRFRLTKCHCC